MKTDFLTAEERKVMAEDFQDIVEDPAIGAEITYRAFNSKGTFSPTSGSILDNTTDYSIYALRAPISERQLTISNDKYQVGDIRYMVPYNDIPSPKKDDRIIDGTNTLYVVDTLTDPLSVFRSIIARNLRGST